MLRATRAVCVLVPRVARVEEALSMACPVDGHAFGDAVGADAFACVDIVGGDAGFASAVVEAAGEALAVAGFAVGDAGVVAVDVDAL